MRDRLRLFLSTRRVHVRVVVLLLAITAGLIVWIGVAGGKAVVAGIPVVVAIVALLSLAVAAGSAVANWRRQKREATVKSWTEWSLSSAAARRELTALFGKENMTTEQAKSLITGTPPVIDASGAQVDDERRRQLLHSFVAALNGLERLAVGANLGVYDSATLKALGGTIIVRTFNRLEPYIHERRTTDHEYLRQKTAFVDLEWLVAEIESRNLLDRKREVDEERLRRLQRG